MVALPVLVWVFGVREAIPILAISQMLTTVSRVWLHRGGLKWPVVRNFVLGAMPFSILGSMFFVSIDTKVLVRILGVMMLFLAVYTRLPIGRNLTMRLWGFVPLGAATGFWPAFLGVTGPFVAVFYLAYGMTASSYIGTASLGMFLIQIPKITIFGTNDLFTLQVLLMGVGLGAIGAGSTYLGRIILRRVADNVFHWIITTMLVVSGIIFVVRA